MGVITFNNIASSTIGLQVATFPDYTIPQREYQVISIPGRDGDLVIDNGNYKPVKKKYEINISVAIQNGLTAQETFSRISNWVHSASGYAKLSDTYDSGYYMLAYYSGPADITNIFNEAGEGELEFTCKPRRYLNSGDTPQTFTAAGTITNPTTHPSEPILNITTNDTQGTVMIGNQSFTIKAGVGGHITVNSELQDAYYGTSNKNNFIVLNDGDFPKIGPGSSAISFNGGIQSVEVIPKWWTV